MYVANRLQEVEGRAVSIMLDFMLLHNQSIVLLLYYYTVVFLQSSLVYEPQITTDLPCTYQRYKSRPSKILGVSNTSNYSAVIEVMPCEFLLF